VGPRSTPGYTCGTQKKTLDGALSFGAGLGQRGPGHMQRSSSDGLGPPAPNSTGAPGASVQSNRASFKGLGLARGPPSIELPSKGRLVSAKTLNPQSLKWGGIPSPLERRTLGSPSDWRTLGSPLERRTLGSPSDWLRPQTLGSPSEPGRSMWSPASGSPTELRLPGAPSPRGSRGRGAKTPAGAAELPGGVASRGGCACGAPSGDGDPLLPAGGARAEGSGFAGADGG